MYKIKESIRDIKRLYESVFGRGNDNIYLIDINGSVESLDGTYNGTIDSILGNTDNSEKKRKISNCIMEGIKREPYRARNFPIDINKGEKRICSFIYIPNSENSPKNFTSDKRLNLEGKINTAEETFHSVYKFKDNKEVGEAMAVLGRYLIFRNSLGESRKSSDINQVKMIFNYDIETAEGIEPGELDRSYFTDGNRNIINVDKKYQERLWLEPYLRYLDNLSDDNAVKEMKKFFNSVKVSEKPLGEIQQKGLDVGMVPGNYL